MRLRRDRRNYQLVVGWMDRINLVRSEHSRQLSRANKSLYEFLHPEEGRPAQDLVINHVVIKADVRGSTELTKDLLDRGMNPASHFSMNLHEPVKRMLERYGAAKVFIEGDAIILAIYEHESTSVDAARRGSRVRAGAGNSGGDGPLQHAGEDHRASATGTGHRSGFSGFRAGAVDGRRFAHHDFEGAEPVGPALELLEHGEEAVSVECFAFQLVSAPGVDG